MKTSWMSLLGRFGAVLAGFGIVAGAIAADVTTERLINSEREPRNWLNHHGNLEAHRYSGLRQINKNNVKNLSPNYRASVFSVGIQ